MRDRMSTSAVMELFEADRRTVVRLANQGWCGARLEPDKAWSFDANAVWETWRVINDPDRISISDAANLLSMSERSARRWASRGFFSARKDPFKGYTLSHSQIYAYLEELKLTFTVKEVAEILGMSDFAVKTRARLGYWGARRSLYGDHQWLFDRQSVLRAASRAD